MAARRRLAAALPLLAVLTLGLAACSPEANRGGGEGADVGNRGEPIQMHGDEDQDDRIFFDTPRKPPIEGS